MTTKLKEIEFRHNQLDDNFLLNSKGNPLTTSDRYRAVASQDLINAFNEVGYQVRAISQPRARIKDNLAFNKHIIRLARQDSIDTINNRIVGKEFPEIVIVNNNNNRGQLQVMLGIFRLVCSNGMILGDQFFSRKIRRNKDFYDNLFNALITASERYDQVNGIIDSLKSIELSSTDLRHYRLMIKEEILRPWLTNDRTVFNSFGIRSTFNPVRIVDQAKDAWTVFNRYQEHIISKGISYVRIDEPKDPKDQRKLIRSTTRPITGADSTVKMNQLLMNKSLEFFNVAV